jgi:hypothetical protein
LKQEYENLEKQVWDCVLINNFFWGVWALALLTPEMCTDGGIFNYDFAHCRVESYQLLSKIVQENKMKKQ